MIARAAAGVLALAAAGAAARPAVTAAPRRLPETTATAVADSFPHERHRRLFTSCGACHAGIPTGDSATARPSPEVCAGCHDGSMVRRVDWAPRPPRGTNLFFDHPAHGARIRALFDMALACASCHAATDDAPLMAVDPARPERCLGCHVPSPEAASHLAQSACTPCHAGLGDPVRVSAAAIASFPKPPTHDSAFVFTHPGSATSGTCATCHAREFCASCHVNAGAVAPIRALASDPRIATLARARRVRYPLPASHRSPDFTRTHGPLARVSVARCANCHTRESCLTCHRLEERASAVALLPRRSRGGARGVDLSRSRPPDHTLDFATRHALAAAGGDASCSRCHAPSYCASCHDGPASPSFHLANFVERHAQDAYTQDTECAVCHRVEGFCAPCHRAVGRTPRAAAAGPFHDSQPMWLLGHGGAARRALETCASCHAQTDCLRCHSASQGWRVSPHGPGFNDALGDRNPALCRRCHLSGPPGR